MKYMGSKVRIVKDICPIEIDKNKYLNVRIPLLLKEQKYGRFCKENAI